MKPIKRRKPSDLLKQQKETGQSYWDMIGYPLPEVTVTADYPNQDRVWDTVDNLDTRKESVPEFINRLNDNDRRYIIDESNGMPATFLMNNDGNYAYPLIQDVNGSLHNYDTKYGDYWYRQPYENGDYIKFATPGDASYFTEHYKERWPEYFQGFACGKDAFGLPGFKNGFDTFANGIGRAIYNEMIANGWYTPARYDNIMSQLSSESGHGTSALATKYHNYGGRTDAKGGYMHFANDEAFAKDHLRYLQRKHKAAWDAKDTISYVNALHKSNYMSDNPEHYLSLLRGQKSARRAWQKAMQTWESNPPKIVEQPDATRVVLPTRIVVPVDNTAVATPTISVPQPTSYIDPTVVQGIPEQLEVPEDETYYASALPPMEQAFGQFFYPGETPYSNDLPMFKAGKDSGIHIKPSHRGRFTKYLKAHPGMTAEKAKHSKSAAVRKMATFALNARHWKH